jgi:hypothetical protein
MISIDKKYRTRDGEDVRILCTDAPGKYPVVGLIEGEEEPQRWTISGGHVNVQKGYYFDLIEVPPWDDFKIDEPVMVRDDLFGKWKPRHFARVINGKPATWLSGCTSWSIGDGDTTRWNECRRPTPEELGEVK